MSTATIKTPAYFTTADIKDIERELIGLVIESAGLKEDAKVDIKGVRAPGLYRSIWATVKHSRNIRRANWVLEVRYEQV